MSGLLFLFLVGLGYALWLAAIPRLREKGRNRGATIAKRAGIIGFGFLVVFNAVGLLGGYERGFLGWKALWSVAALLIIPGGFLTLEDHLKTLVQRYREGDSARTSAAGVNLLAQVVTLLGTLSLYAWLVYPNLLAVYGGGRKPPARLVLSEEGLRILRSLGAVGDEDSAVGEIVLEANDYLLFKPRSEVRKLKAVRIRNDFVKAIAYSDENFSAASPTPKPVAGSRIMPRVAPSPTVTGPRVVTP
jgi:hypothetical protein